MNSRLLMLTVILIGFSSLFLLLVVYDTPPPTTEPVMEARPDLKEVVYADTNCSKYWRLELFEMWNDPKYDYKNDPIFTECSEALNLQNTSGNK